MELIQKVCTETLVELFASTRDNAYAKKVLLLQAPFMVIVHFLKQGTVTFDRMTNTWLNSLRIAY
jgi:hypothetical protein